MSMRIGGLASGMDIDSLVNDLISAERTKVDKVEQDKLLLEYTRDAYNAVNEKFAKFVLNTRESFGRLSSTRNDLSWMKEASSSNSTIVEASARASATNGTYSINVGQLATNWSAASGSSISENAIDNDKSNLQSQFALTESDTINFTITTNQGTNREQKVEVFIDKDKAYIKASDKDGKEEKIDNWDEGKNISNLSLNDMVKKINHADIGVTAVYDESIDRFFLQTDETGADNTVQIVDESRMYENGQLKEADNFIDKLQLQYVEYDDNGNIQYDEEGNIQMGSVSSDSQEEPKVYAGQNAIIDFGAAKGIEQSSNQFTINNIDFDLKAKGDATIKVGTNGDTVIEKLTDFVDQYNELVDEVNNLLAEKRYRDYPPLTDVQRDEMSDKEIELWEEKSKSGLLRNDSIISGTMQTIRSGLYEGVQGLGGSFSHLTEIGIATEEYSSGSMGGKLEIDEDVLRKVLGQDTDGVMELLFKNPDSSITDETQKRQNTGLVGRMYNDMITGMKEMITKAGPGDESQLYRDVNTTMLLDFVKGTATGQGGISLLDKNIMNYEKRIVGLERRLADQENRYWSQFSAMETALSNMNAQSDWLYQQMGM